MKLIFSLILVLFSFIFSSCNNDSREAESPLISAEKVFSVSPDDMRNYINNFTDSQNIRYVFGYDAYRITYRTKDSAGNEVIASGLLTVPIPPDDMPPQQKKLFSSPIILNEHGTIFRDNDAPSYNFHPGNNSTFPIIALFTGLYGFTTAMPDYIGYGASKEHFHPYLIKKDLAQDSIDFLKACIDFCEQNGLKTRRDVYITGYSEGGYVAMATAQRLQENPEYLINVKGVSPLDGVYDLETMALGLMFNPSLNYPSFVAYLVYAYSLAYPQEIVLDEIIGDTYISILPSLFDGTKSREEIDSVLPKNINQLFKIEYISDFVSNNENSLRVKLKENNVDEWVPHFPLQIVHCGHDDVIPYQLAQLSYSNIVSLGGNDIIFVDPEVVFNADNDGWNHAQCAKYAYQIAANWFCILDRGNDMCSGN